MQHRHLALRFKHQPFSYGTEVHGNTSVSLTSHRRRARTAVRNKLQHGKPPQPTLAAVPHELHKTASRFRHCRLPALKYPRPCTQARQQPEHQAREPPPRHDVDTAARQANGTRNSSRPSHRLACGARRCRHRRTPHHAPACLHPGSTHSLPPPTPTGATDRPAAARAAPTAAAAPTGTFPAGAASSACRRCRQERHKETLVFMFTQQSSSPSHRLASGARRRRRRRAPHHAPRLLHPRQHTLLTTPTPAARRRRSARCCRPSRRPDGQLPGSCCAEFAAAARHERPDLVPG